MHIRSKAVIDNLYNLLLSQRSVNCEMPYDLLEKIIQESIDYVKTQNINARIANVVLNINDRLVIAQVYVERKNAFAVTKDNRFGTSPTEYNVQVRFPFGLETNLNGQALVIPGGNFANPLKAYNRINGSVTEDVQKDFEPENLICGPGVKKQLNNEGPKKRITFSTFDGQDSLTLTYGETIGAGYIKDKNFIDYYYIEDHELRHKMAGLYPLFYSQGAMHGEEKEEILLRRHQEYPGYTRLQDGIYELKDEQQNPERKKEYHDFIQAHSEELTHQAAGRRWADRSWQHRGSAYVFNITQINGNLLYTESGLPLTRLRDYQLELFQNCLAFVEDIETGSSPIHAGQINMGVGSGKTFFTFTLLQQLKHRMREVAPEQLLPPFCMAPDEGVAQVIKHSIDRQGVFSGMSATLVTKQEEMPNPEFLQLYKILSEKAQQAAKQADAYLQTGIQAELLAYCRENCLHPLTMINLFYAEYNNDELTQRINLFKDSIDMKRLLLLIEGQKNFIHRTGMLRIDGLNNLLEQFTAIEEEMENQPLLKEVECKEMKPLSINYNQPLALPSQLYGNELNLATVTQEELLALLQQKHPRNLRGIREAVMRMACLNSVEAAVLLANSGGLGNTYSDAQLQKQIADFLPEAVNHLHALANKKKHSYLEHYTLNLYLKEIYSTVPYEVNFNQQLGELRAVAIRYECQQALNHHIRLVKHMRKAIADKISKLGTVETVPELQESKTLSTYGIKKSDNLIWAANQLVGVASLAITGRAQNTEASLLLSHVPVFTPQGLACYFEYLQTLEKKPQVAFQEKFGVYKIAGTSKKIGFADIKARLEQALKAVMIADEAHKEEYSFLYDPQNPIHIRINAITKRYLGKSFAKILPPRIGMSGTSNTVSKKAFGGKILYDLSTPKMIRRGLIKQISIHTQPAIEPEAKDPSQEERRHYAMRIVADYFTQNSELAIRNVLSGKNYSVDLFTVSKGLLFSKQKDPALNNELVECFNLLTKMPDMLSPEQKAIQDALFTRINKQRQDQQERLQQKLSGILPLSPAECLQVEIYNQANPQKTIQLTEDKAGNFCIGNSPREEKSAFLDLGPQQLQEMQRLFFMNSMFAIYLEYVLSKSSAPKEFSDLIGLQNKIHERGFNLMTGIQTEQDILTTIETVDPRSMTREDAARFIQARIKDPAVAKMMIDGILTFVNRPNPFIQHLQKQTLAIKLEKLITTDRSEFESGLACAMLGEEKEQTGYSHEPVGLVITIPTALTAIQEINNSLSSWGAQELKASQVSGFLKNLHELMLTTFSYDEANQAGGRALRTPSGHVKYIEYSSDLNRVLSDEKLAHSPLAALKIETSFQDIFITNETRAKQERASINFNRFALMTLMQKDLKWADFYRSITAHLQEAELISDENARLQYEGYMTQRLPLLWAMKYQPESAAPFFQTQDAALFEKLRLEISVLPPLSLTVQTTPPPVRDDCIHERELVSEPDIEPIPSVPFPKPDFVATASPNSAGKTALTIISCILGGGALIAGACLLSLTTAPIWLGVLFLGLGLASCIPVCISLRHRCCLPTENQHQKTLCSTAQTAQSMLSPQVDNKPQAIRQILSTPPSPQADLLMFPGKNQETHPPKPEFKAQPPKGFSQKIPCPSP